MNPHATTTGETWSPLPAEDPTFRQMRRTVRTELGASPAVAWRSLGEVGAWVFATSVDDGGLDLGNSAAAMVCEEAGVMLNPLPVVDAFVSAAVFARLGRADLVARVADGEVVVWAGTLPADAAGGTNACAANAGTDAVVRGPFPAAVTARSALVVERRDGHTALRLLTGPSDGLAVEHLVVDSAAAVLADAPANASSSAETLVEDDALDALLAEVAPIVALYQAALLTGLATAAVDTLLDRIRSRVQFGATIAAQQSPRHRAAAALTELDVLRTHLDAAARAYDDGAAPALGGLVALAAETALTTSRELVHLHGASGLVDGTAASLCYRRIGWEALRCGPLPALWAAVGGRASTG